MFLCRFEKFLRTTFLQNTSLWFLLYFFLQICCSGHFIINSILVIQYWVLPSILCTTLFSPVWTRMCFFKYYFEANLLSHKLQLNGFSSVWVLIWTLIADLLELLIPHISHLNGLTLLWTSFICLFNWLLVLVLKWQKSHLNGFSPVCIMICFLKISQRTAS